MEASRKQFGLALALEVAPAALFGAAVAFASAMFLAAPPITVEPLAAGAAAFAAAWAALRKFGAARDPFPVRQFDPALLEPEFVEDIGEQPHPAAAPDAHEPSELLLEDVLAGVGPESRVVYLFQPNGRPTAGKLHAQIEQHLRSTGRSATAADATEALHEALAALRRSLR